MDKQSSQAKSPSRELTAGGFALRFAGSLILVLATYNPSGVSLFHWIQGAESLGAVHFVAGIVVLIGWAILLAATWRSLDTLGLVLGVALLGGLVWLLIDVGVLTLDSASAVAWVVLVCIGVLLGIGLCWSHIWRRLTGQFEVDQD